MKKDITNRGREILRFVITGLIAAIIDFAFYTLTSYLLKKSSLDPKGVPVTIICTIVGFAFGVVINYFLSVFWVFQNVDKKNQNKHKSLKVIIFVLLSIGGLLISIGIMASCKTIFQKCCNINIDSWWDIPFNGFGKWLVTVLSSLTFWLYAVSFVLKTLGGLVFNYISRKKILFKEPIKYGHNKTK